MLDTRNEISRLLKHFQFSSGKALLKSMICVLLAWLAARAPGDPALGEAARMSLAITVLAATLWISEAIPAFAVALLVIGLQVITLGRPGGVLAGVDEVNAWEIYVRPWSSPPLWLFFGGLVLACAAQRTQIDEWIAGKVVRLTGGKPLRLLPAIMGVTFLFSMFMSNTATCAMMLAILLPTLATLPKEQPTAKALLLALAFAANIGGMATIIGTPPNAIAAGLLEASNPVSFVQWMVMGGPPALLLAALIWFILVKKVDRNSPPLSVGQEAAADGLETSETQTGVRNWQRWLTLLVFVLTIALWMTGNLHQTPTAVVSFIPIVVLSMIGVMRPQDIRSLNWDVLILLAGGLSLGVGIESSGLALWVSEMMKEIDYPLWVSTLVLTYVATLASNLMSNTAAANILFPIGLALAKASAVAPTQILVPIALGCAIAMALPIATPPNALIYASGRISAKDLLPVGLLTLVVGPPVITLWVGLVGR